MVVSPLGARVCEVWLIELISEWGIDDVGGGGEKEALILLSLLACPVVTRYPTVNLRSLRFNYLDLSDVGAERNASRAQAGRFSSICKVYAPFYRQATLRNFVGNASTRFQAFNLAFSDVEAAFDHYLSNHNSGRPFVLLGHSQGARMISQLLQTRFAVGSPLRQQLIVAMPIGCGMATSNPFQPTASGEWPWDQVAPVRVCTSGTDTRCVLSYRSYAGGNAMATHKTVGGGSKTIMCVNPAGFGSGTEVLSDSIFATDPQRVYFTRPPGFTGSTPFLLYRNMYTAQCTVSADNSGLEVNVKVTPGSVRTNPINFTADELTGDTATHGLDVPFALGDLIAIAAVKAAALIATPAPITAAPTTRISPASNSDDSDSTTTIFTILTIITIICLIGICIAAMVVTRHKRRKHHDPPAAAEQARAAPSKVTATVYNPAGASLTDGPTE
jgi:hypothetical protein